MILLNNFNRIINRNARAREALHAMTITPAIKGQLTKAVNAANQPNTIPSAKFLLVRQVFRKHLPREQAKHAARRFIASARQLSS